MNHSLTLIQNQKSKLDRYNSLINTRINNMRKQCNGSQIPLAINKLAYQRLMANKSRASSVANIKNRLQKCRSNETWTQRNDGVSHIFKKSKSSNAHSAERMTNYHNNIPMNEFQSLSSYLVASMPALKNSQRDG